jgi:hypothetical protein
LNDILWRINRKYIDYLPFGQERMLPRLATKIHLFNRQKARALLQDGQSMELAACRFKEIEWPNKRPHRQGRPQAFTP